MGWLKTDSGQEKSDPKISSFQTRWRKSCERRRKMGILLSTMRIEAARFLCEMMTLSGEKKARANRANYPQHDCALIVNVIVSSSSLRWIGIWFHGGQKKKGQFFCVRCGEREDGDNNEPRTEKQVQNWNRERRNEVKVSFNSFGTVPIVGKEGKKRKTISNYVQRFRWPLLVWFWFFLQHKYRT